MAHIGSAQPSQLTTPAWAGNVQDSYSPAQASEGGKSADLTALP